MCALINIHPQISHPCQLGALRALSHYHISSHRNFGNTQQPIVICVPTASRSRSARVCVLTVRRVVPRRSAIINGPHQGGGVGGVAMPALVRRVVQQQCDWQNVAQRFPVSDDGDHDPVAEHHRLQWTVLQFVGRPQVRRHPVAVLHANDCAAGAGQVPGVGHVAHIYLEGARFVCAHWYVHAQRALFIYLHIYLT